MNFSSMVRGFETLRQTGPERFFKTATKCYSWDQDIVIHTY